MPELTPQQKAQLDKNIRGMLSQGASQEDVITYSKDFRNKYDVAIVEPPIKKKEPLDWVSRTFGASTSPTTSNGNGLPLQKEQKTTGLTKTGKTVDGIPTVPIDEEKVNLTNAITQTNFKKNERPFDQTKEEAIKVSTKKLNDIMFGEGDEWKDPIKTAVKGVQKSTTTKEAQEHLGVKNLTEMSLMPDGFEAKKTLANTILGKMGDDNLTAKTVRDKAAEYDKVAQPFRDLGEVNYNDERDFGTRWKLYDAAIKSYANKNPTFRKQAESVGIDFNGNDLFLKLGDSDAKTGQIVANVLNDKDFNTFLQKENPSLLPSIKKISDDLMFDNKDYGKNVMANEISRAMEEEGFNKIDPIFNFEGEAKKNGEVVANGLYQNDPRKKQFYEEHKDEILNMLDAPSFFEGFGTQAKDILKSTGQTFTSWFTPSSESVKNKWDTEANNVSADPKGFSKWIRDLGGVTGLISTIGATANLTGIANPTTAGAAATILNFWGGELENKKADYPDRPVTAIGLATINTGLYALLAKDIFPATKIKSAFDRVQPEIKSAVENFTSGKINLEAARKKLNTAFSKATDFVTGTASKTAKVSFELTGITASNRLLEKIAGMDDEQFKQLHPDDELANTLVHTFTTFAPISALGKFGEMRKRNKVVEETIYDAVSKPLQTQRAFDRASLDLSFGTMNEIKDNFNIALNAKKELDQLKIHPKDQKRFIFEALKEKAAKDAIEASTDPTIQKQNKDAIKESQEIKEKILAGEDADTIVTESQQKKIDEAEETRVEVERLTVDRELANKKIDAKIEETDGRESEANRIKLQELKEEKKRVNEDYDKKLSKLTPPDPLTPEQEVLKKALDNKEISGVLKGVAESALKDPKMAIEFIEDAKDQINNQVASASGNPAELAKETFGKTISDHVSPKEEAPTAASQNIGATGLYQGTSLGNAEKILQNKGYKKGENYDDVRFGGNSNEPLDAVWLSRDKTLASNYADEKVNQIPSRVVHFDDSNLKIADNKIYNEYVDKFKDKAEEELKKDGFDGADINADETSETKVWNYEKLKPTKAEKATSKGFDKESQQRTYEYSPHEQPTGKEVQAEVPTVGGEITEESVKQKMDANNSFSKKITEGLKKIGQVADDFIFGGFVQKDGKGGYWAGDTHFKNDGTIDHVTSKGTTKIDSEGNVISTDVLQGNAKKANDLSENISSKKESIKSLKETRDSEDFKYKTVNETDPNNPLATRKVKRLKTKEELEASTKKINEVIAKSESELEQAQKEYDELPEDVRKSQEQPNTVLPESKTIPVEGKAKTETNENTDTPPSPESNESKPSKKEIPTMGEAKEGEPPTGEEPPKGEGTEGEGDWTHINKKDITDAEEIANKHPFGESESWKNSVSKGLAKLRKLVKAGESLYDAAKNKVTEWATKVKQQIMDEGKSTFNPSDEEIAQMAFHRAMTNKKIADLESDLTSPIEGIRGAAEIVLSDLETQRELVDYVLHNTATTAGRAFNIRQMVSQIDAENGLKVKRMDIIRKQKGQPLSEKQEEEIRDIYDEEVANQKAKDEYAKKKAEQDFEAAVKTEVDRRMKEQKGRKPSSKPFARTKAGNVIRKLKQPGTRLDITFGTWDLLVEGVAKLVDTGITVAEAVGRLIKDGTIAFKTDKDRDSAIDHIDNAQRHVAIDSIRELAEKEKSDNLTKSAVGKNLVNDLVSHYIDKGLRAKDVFNELNKDLKELFPEITEQQVRDAYLKEGEFTLEKKENLNKAKIEAKAELKGIAKLETDLADLKEERDTRKRKYTERQKTETENKLLAEKNNLLKKKDLTEKEQKRFEELNKELERLQQRKEKDKKQTTPKQIDRSEREKELLTEIDKQKKDWAKEKQAQRDLDVAAKKAKADAEREAKRLKDLNEKLDRLNKGQRDAPKTSTPKVESPQIEQLKKDVADADKKLREAESESNRLNKEANDKADKLQGIQDNIDNLTNNQQLIKKNKVKSDRQVDTDIADAENRLQKALNKQGLKLEKGSKAEQEQKQKVVDLHNERAENILSDINDRLVDDKTTDAEKAALNNAKKLLEKAKVNKDSALDIFDAVDKAEKNIELARAELAQFEKLSDIKKQITQSQIQMGKDKLSTEQDILLQRHKDNLNQKINETERRVEAGEFVENVPAKLKTTDAEAVRLEIKDRHTKNKLDRVGRSAQRAAMTKREKVIDTIQSLYVIGLVGRFSTLVKVGISAITKQPLNTITSQTFGRLGSIVFPKIENALRGEGVESWIKEKNRYLAHYGAMGEKGMAKMISKGKEAAQKADEAYLNAKDKLEDIENKHGKDSNEYKTFANGEFKKAENEQKKALLNNVTNSMYEWIGGNAWEDAAEVFLHSTAKLEQLLGQGERIMWKDRTRREKIMFVLSSSAATHGVLKNFSARAEFAANFVARLENKVKQGIDISSPEEILKTINESYVGFERGKYQEDNALTGGFKAGLEGIQKWGERHPDYKYAADLMAGVLKFKNPIVRTPVNIAREAIVEYTLGVPLAIAKYRGSIKDARIDAKKFDLAGQAMKDHMKKFMDNLPPDKADFIYRAFRKGGFGLGVMALTAMGGISYGGFFNRDERRRKKGDELGVNEVEIGGHKLSHLEAKVFTHTSAFFPALLWSNYQRVREEGLKEGHGEVGANLDAAMKNIQGMIDQVPMGKEMSNPLQSIQVPLVGPFLTEIAEQTDTDAEGHLIKRKPKGNPLEKLLQNIEMKFPGLRQNVPVSQSQGNTITPEEEKIYPTIKEFADKELRLPEFDPAKIQTKEVNGKVTEHLSDYPEEVQKKYLDTKKKYYEQELKSLKNGTYQVYRDKDGTVHIESDNVDVSEMKYVPFKDLTKEDIQYLSGTYFSGNATKKTKADEILKKPTLKPVH